MSRQVLTLMLLLILVSSDTAFARRGLYRRARQHNSHCNPSKRFGAKGIPCYCLTRKYLDYPGPYDLWECTTFPDGCDTPETAEDDLYYGFPTPGTMLPEHCGTEPCGTCEGEGGYAKQLNAFGDGKLPGHERVLRSKAEAWKAMEDGLSAAGFNTSTLEHEFYKIPYNPRIGRAVFVIVAKIPPSGSVAENRYLGLEIEPHSETLDTVSFSSAPVPGIGRQFTIKYRAHNNDRTARVWLRD